MTQGQIKNGNGETIAEFGIPSGLAELPLNRYVDFLVETKRLREGANYVDCMAKAVSAFYGIDIARVLESQIGDLSKAEPGDFDGTLSTLFAYASKVAAAFKPQMMTPETATFTHKGIDFKMPYILQQAVIGEPILPGIETIEAIEAAEVQRLAMAEIGKEQGDPDGSHFYTMHLRLLAILARQDGERLPISDGERAAFLNERTVFFQDIDAATGMNIEFFFQNFLPPSNQTPQTLGFFSRLHFGQTAEMLWRKGRHTTGRKKGTKKFLGGSGGGNLSSRYSKKGGSQGRIAAR